MRLLERFKGALRYGWLEAGKSIRGASGTMVRQWHREGSEERAQARERQHTQRNGIQGAELEVGALMVLRKTLQFSSRPQGRCVVTVPLMLLSLQICFPR